MNTSFLKNNKSKVKQHNNVWFRNYTSQATQYEKNPKGKIIYVSKPKVNNEYSTEGQQNFIIKCKNAKCNRRIVKAHDNIEYCKPCYLDSIGFQVCKKCGKAKKKNKFDICYKCFSDLHQKC